VGQAAGTKVPQNIIKAARDRWGFMPSQRWVKGGVVKGGVVKGGVVKGGVVKGGVVKGGVLLCYACGVLSLLSHRMTFHN
jgi:hypothetical protein